MIRSLQHLGVRSGARSVLRSAVRPSATLLPSLPPRPRSRLVLACLGLAAGAGLVGTVAATAPAAVLGSGSAPATVAPARGEAAAVPVPPLDRHPALVAPSRATRSITRAPLTRQVTHQVTRTVPVAPAFSGDASWYGPGFEGHPTATGDRYDSSLLTAASKTLPLGSHLNVCHNGACVTVLVNDRGPYVGDRVLDLSHAAAAQIGLLDSGVGFVTATPVETRQVTETVTETVAIPAAPPQP